MLEVAELNIGAPPEVQQFHTWWTDVDQALKDASAELKPFAAAAPESPAHLVSVKIRKKPTSPEAAENEGSPTTISSTPDEKLTKKASVDFFHDYLKQFASTSQERKELREKLIAGEEVDAWKVLVGLQSYIFALIRSWPICRNIHKDDLSRMKDLLNSIMMELHRYWPRYNPVGRGTIKAFVATYTQTAVGRISQGRNQFHRRMTKAEVTTNADYDVEYHFAEVREAFAATPEGEVVRFQLRLKKGFQKAIEVATREYEYASVATAIEKYYARHGSVSLDDPLRNDGEKSGGDNSRRSNKAEFSTGMVNSETVHSAHREAFLERFWEIANGLFEEMVNDPERKKGGRDADVVRTILFEKAPKGKKLTLAAVGKKFDLSRERVRQLKNEFLEDLKRRLEAGFSKREKELLRLYLSGSSEQFAIEEAIDLRNLPSN